MKLRQRIKKLILIIKIFINITPIRLYKRILKISILKILGKSFPYSAIIAVTYRCNLNCLHCSASIYIKEKFTELKTEEIKELLDKIYKLNIPRINITGGDPFLRSDLYEIISYASQKFIVILESNGINYEMEKIKKLKEAKLSCLAVSIDSPDPILHNMLRNQSNLFDKAITTLINAKKLKLPTIISTYITSKNINKEYFEKLKELCKSTGALAVRILPLRPVGNSVKYYKEEDLLSYDDEIKIEKIIDKDIFYFRGIPGSERCGIFTQNTFYISPYGEVQPCPYLPISFGNIKNSDLKIILEKMWDHKIFKNTNTLNCLIIDKKFREENISNIKIFPLEI